MDNFQNDQIFSLDLPHVEDLAFERLHPNRRWQILISSAIWLLALMILLTLGYRFISFVQTYIYLITFIILLLWIIVTLASIMEYYFAGYAIRDHDLSTKSGWIYRSTTFVPYNRVQHSEIVEGFIARKLGLASIHLFTAGGSDADIEISGLSRETALHIKSFIMNKARPVSDEEE